MSATLRWIALSLSLAALSCGGRADGAAVRGAASGSAGGEDRLDASRRLEPARESPPSTEMLGGARNRAAWKKEADGDSLDGEERAPEQEDVGGSVPEPSDENDSVSDGDEAPEDDQSERDSEDEGEDAERDEEPTNGDGGADGEDDDPATDDGAEGEDDPEGGDDEGSGGSSRQRVGWRLSLVGAGGGQVRGEGPAWFGGVEIGYLTRVADGDYGRVQVFGGARGLMFALADPREPNEDASHPAFGVRVSVPVHLGSEDIAFVIEPSAGMIFARESAVTPAAWGQGGLGVGLAFRVFHHFRLTVTAGGEVWMPFANTDTAGFGSIQLGIEHTWSSDDDAEEPVSVDTFFGQLERGALSDMIHEPAAYACEVGAVDDEWSAPDGDGECAELASALEPQHCALFVGVGHRSDSNVDMRTSVSATWEDRDRLTAFSIDTVTDHWPVNVVCNWGDGRTTPRVEVRALGSEPNAMTIRRYGVSLAGPRAPDETPEVVSPTGDLEDVGGCVAVHVPRAGRLSASLGLPRNGGGAMQLRVWAPRVAGVRTRFREGSVAEVVDLTDITMEGAGPLPFTAADGERPFLEIEAPVIATPVMVCVADAT